jgi:hypothetical protein
MSNEGYQNKELSTHVRKIRKVFLVFTQKISHKYIIEFRLKCGEVGMSFMERLLHSHTVVHEGRQYLRHPAEVPIEVCPMSGPVPLIEQTVNVSQGGMAFESDIAWEKDAMISVQIMFNPPIQLFGKVAWCRQNGQRFSVGIEFLEKTETQKQDVVDEVCQVEMYKKMLSEIARLTAKPVTSIQ